MGGQIGGKVDPRLSLVRGTPDPIVDIGNIHLFIVVGVHCDGNDDASGIIQGPWLVTRQHPVKDLIAGTDIKQIWEFYTGPFAAISDGPAVSAAVAACIAADAQAAQ